MRAQHQAVFTSARLNHVEEVPSLYRAISTILNLTPNLTLIGGGVLFRGWG